MVEQESFESNISQAKTETLRLVKEFDSIFLDYAQFEDSVSQVST